MKPVKKEVIRKSNILVNGQYRFGLHEQKILLLVISKIKTTQESFRPYHVSWDEIQRVTSGKLNTIAKIDKACTTLKNKTISIKEGKSTDNFGFLSGWKTRVSRYVEFRIDPSMQRMLLNLLQDGHFTLYDLEFALALPSTHSIRIYEILKSHSWKKQPIELELADIKRALDISVEKSAYTDFGSFRRFVLDKAQKNLKKYTDITFTYKTIKEARRVVALSVTIKENKKYQRTVQAATVDRKTVRPGDKVLIGGKECKIHSSGCFYSDGVIPIGKINQLLTEGKIQLLKG